MRSATLQNKLFSQNPTIKKNRSTFKRISDLKTAFDGGRLIPIYCDETLPGDTFNFKATLFGRLATPLVPYMDNAYLETFWFWCPNRLLWTNFVKQQGEQDNPGDSIAYLTPILSNFTAATSAPGTNFDYFGHPVTTSPFTDAPTITSLHFRMLNKVWNEWFRDQNLQNSLPVPLGDGPDDYAVNFDYVHLINKYHDYLTSCLPWPQKGTAPTMNLGGNAPVIGTAEVWGSASASPNTNTPANSPIGLFWADRATTDGNFYGYTTQLDPLGSGGSLPSPLSERVNPNIDGSGGSGNYQNTQPTMVYADRAKSQALVPGATAPWMVDTTNGNTLVADLASATGFTLNAFREFVATQRFMEVGARGGTRYNENIYARWGVVNPDNRTNRTLFLGSSRQAINVQPVAQTSESSGTPQGTLAAYGTVGAQCRWFQSFNEHGYIIGLACVRADLHYQQILERMFTRRTQYDYANPEFAHLGEQAVLKSEVSFSGVSADDNAVFGYIPRFDDYRWKISQITGLMRSLWSTSLDFWHLAQDFGGASQSLGPTFIREDAPWSRVLAVTDEPEFILNAYFENISTRILPVRAIPGLMRI